MAHKKDDLKQAEKYAYQTLSVDGLADFWTGVTILLIGIGWMRDDLVLLAIFSALITIPLWRLSRKYLSEPRLGSVNFSEKRRAKFSRKLLMSVLLGSFMLGVFAFFAFDPDEIGRDFLQDIIPMMPAFLLALMAAIGAWILSAPRFLFYAAWLVASAFLGMAYFGHPAAEMMFGAIAPISGGIIHFAYFLKNNPKADA